MPDHRVRCRFCGMDGAAQSMLHCNMNRLTSHLQGHIVHRSKDFFESQSGEVGLSAC